MENEQPVADSGSIEQRMSAVFAGEAKPEAAAKPAVTIPTPDAEPEDTSEVEAEASDDAEEAPPDEPFVEVTDDEGNAIPVPSKLKDAFLRQQDYTRKTQELSTLKKSADDRIKYAEAKEQILGTVLQDVVSLRETQSKLDQLNGLDWAQLYNADPGQALSLRNQMDGLRAQVEKQQKTIQEKAAQYDQTRKAHNDNQWKLAVEGVRQKIGSVSAAEDAAMLRTAQDLGFTPDELKERFADPRVLHAVYMASKYSQIQSGKPSASEKLNKAPPVVKPGAVQQNATVKKDQVLRQRLKTTGNVNDAAALLRRIF
jgi:hypothetical protein